MGDDAPDHFHLLVRQFVCVQRQRRLELDVFHQFLCQFLHRQDDICQTRGDGSQRHASVFCLVRVLNHQQPAFLLDGFDSHRAVCPAARKYDSYRIGMTICQAAEEMIDGRPLTAWLYELGNIDLAVLHHQAPIWRNHIYMISLCREQTGHLLHGHACVLLQKFWQVTLMLGMKMCDHNIRQACLAGQGLEEYLQCLQATCRRANPHDRDFVVLRGMKVYFVRLYRFMCGCGRRGGFFMVTFRSHRLKVAWRLLSTE